MQVVCCDWSNLTWAIFVLYDCYIEQINQQSYKCKTIFSLYITYYYIMALKANYSVTIIKKMLCLLKHTCNLCPVANIHDAVFP